MSHWDSAGLHWMVLIIIEIADLVVVKIGDPVVAHLSLLNFSSKYILLNLAAFTLDFSAR